MSPKMLIRFINYVLILTAFRLSHIGCVGKEVPEDMKRLINVNNCLFFYMRSVSVRSANSSILITSYDSLRNFPTFDESKCWQIKGSDPNADKEALLDLTYRKTNDKLQLRLQIAHNSKMDYWSVKRGTAIITDSKSSQPIHYDLDVEKINAETQFSYSCSQLNIWSKVGDKSNDLDRIRLVFEGFQLQPFGNPKSSYVFADSSDCQQWMTLGLWMGSVTLILFTTILIIGVFALWKVNTPDRFENPKGKPLILTNTDE